jgi:hypothetical protein
MMRAMMRAICWLTYPGMLALTLARPAPAQGPAELQPLINRVLEAYGGETRLSRLQAFVERTKVTAPDGHLISTLDRYTQLPDRIRVESEFEVQGKRVRCAMVYAGDRSWRHTEGQPTVPHRSSFKGRREPLKYAGPRTWLRLKAPAYTLRLLDETKVGDRLVFGIGVKSPDASEERCFFDKETGLLVKVEQTLSFSYPAGKPPVLEETLYSRYEAVDGIPIARAITKKSDGRTTQQIEVVEFRVADRLNAELFQEP